MFDNVFNILDTIFFTGCADIAPENAIEYPYKLHEGSLNFQALEMLNIGITNIQKNDIANQP